MNLYKQILTHNDCYQQGKSMIPRGVMVHSTGADNPNLSRYIPGDDILGRNTAGNHWDQSNAEWRKKFGVGLNKCVHAFVGKRANGSVAAVQTLPWTMVGWHAGNTVGNGEYIGFEICEDSLDDPGYFDAAYRQAVELTAELCRRYDLDPLEDGVVISHAEGSKRGIASNHADVDHWFKRFGVTMDDFREDVNAVLQGEVMLNDTDWFARQLEAYRKRLQDNKHADWSRAALEWVKEQGIFAGAPEEDGQTNYMWQDFVTREQLAVILHQLLA